MLIKNIALIGMMGSGKSKVSKMLEANLSRVRVSTDQLIEDQEAMSIPEIFSQKGEAYFRESEKKVIADLAEKTGIIIDCGGGVVLDPQNLAVLRKNSILIFLESSAQAIYQRVKDQKKRPLLNVDNPKERIQQIIDQRESIYKTADHTVSTEDGNIQRACTEIMEIISNE